MIILDLIQFTSLVNLHKTYLLFSLRLSKYFDFKNREV